MNGQEGELNGRLIRHRSAVLNLTAEKMLGRQDTSLGQQMPMRHKQTAKFALESQRRSTKMSPECSLPRKARLVKKLDRFYHGAW